MERLFLTIVSLSILIIVASVDSGAWAQDTPSASDEFTLEEITVTAEKREEDVQKIPASVFAITGVNLMEEGRIGLKEFLENVPNVSYATSTMYPALVDSGISIRGVGGFRMSSNGQPPSAVSTYVDGVFGGFGGGYDISRVEILRGPQGTLYGRSATSGVVSYVTNNPILSEWSGSFNAQIGEANLRDAQLALNIPLGDMFALRVAGHTFEREGYHNPEGGYSESKEARMKLLFKPSDALEIILSGNYADNRVSSGGLTAYLTTPTTINYSGKVTDVLEGGPRLNNQVAWTVNWHLNNGSTVTYIGSKRRYKDDESPGSVMVGAMSINIGYRINPGEDFHTEEIRLASGTEGRLLYLIGANYYKGKYDRSELSVQHEAYLSANGPVDPDPDTIDAYMFLQKASGIVENKGLFTEETFKLRDDLRITGGLRYDKTLVDSAVSFLSNSNRNENLNYINPPILIPNPYADVKDMDNITYKLRLEYDVTPDNMLYALTSTGFRPGDIKLASKWTPTGIIYTTIPFEEEKLTAYEVGSKNRFLDETMQMNIDFFYYDYEGYTHLVNTSPAGRSPTQNSFTTPLRMYGMELDTVWLASKKDKVTLTGSICDTLITYFPTLPDVGNLREWMAFDDNIGTPKYTANLGYDHVFYLPNGSALTARSQLHYRSGYQVTNPTQDQVTEGAAPYGYQKSYMTGDVGITWESPKGMFSLSGNVRNITDKEYKVGTVLSTSLNAIQVTVGEPRVWILSLTGKF